LGPGKAAQLLGIPTPGAGAVEALGLPQMHPALDGAPQWLGVGNTQDLTLGYLPLGQEHNVHVVIEAVPHIGHAIVRDHSRSRKQGSDFPPFPGLSNLKGVCVQYGGDAQDVHFGPIPQT